MAKVQDIVEGLKVHADFWELIGAGVIKYFEESLLYPVIGNGTYMSGAIKLFAGAMLKKSGLGKIGDMLSTAFIIDGTEDITRQLVKLVPFKVGTNSNENFQTI